MFFFFFQAEDGIRDLTVTGVQTCALPISRPCAPQRLNALNTTAAFWSKGVRHSAGTVRMLCREMTPTWRAWLTCLTQVSTWTLAQRQHSADWQRSAPRWVPWPHRRQRYATSPIGAGLPHASILAT